MLCSVLSCVSGRVDLFERHLAALADTPNAKQIQYCLGLWGDCTEHRRIIGAYAERFGLVELVQVSDEPYFPLPQAFNAALTRATCDTVVVLGSEVVVPGDLVSWATSHELSSTAWVAACINTADARWLIGTQKHGAWPYCMAASAENLRRVGGWDEAFSDGVVFDDTDLGLRLIASGVDFRWDYSYAVQHQSHPRTHGSDRAAHAAHNKRLVESRLNGFSMDDVWPCWWRELYTGKTKQMPQGDGLPEQAALRDELRRRGYPSEGHCNGIRRNVRRAAMSGAQG